MAKVSENMMRRITIGIVIVGLTSIASAEEPSRPAPNLLDQALAKADLSWKQVQLAPDRWRDGGVHSLPLFDMLWDDWRKLDPVAQQSGRAWIEASGSMESLVRTGAGQLGVKLAAPDEPARPTDTAKADAGQLSQAIERLYVKMKWDLSDQQKQQLREQAAVVPAPVGQAAAELLEGVPPALEFRDKALGAWSQPQKLQSTVQSLLNFAMSYDVGGDMLALLDKIDLASLLQGGAVLASAMDRAGRLMAGASPDADFSFQWPTPLGNIELCGRPNATHDAGQCLLILDTAGHDTCTWKTTPLSIAEHPISLIIDASGNDHYIAEGPGGIGAGVAGYGFLLNLGGNNSYEAKDAAIGVGIGGVGVVMDRSGHDTCSVHAFGEGAATCGLGILCSQAGDNHYACYQCAQGLGQTMGVGAIVNLGGNDAYVANDTDLQFPAAQTPKHNTSLAQGCGYGRRANPGDGHSLAGGLGILVDQKGHNTYQAGVFAQGCSYWYGLGMLYNGGDNDSYEGQWYVQGSAVHYSVAALIGVGGHDHYISHIAQNTGHAKDNSAGLLHDLGGNNVYECGMQSLGSAWFGAVGILWNDSGGNSYKADDRSFGLAESVSWGDSSCVGIVVDGGGGNQVNAPGVALAADGSLWQVLRPENRVYGIRWMK